MVRYSKSAGVGENSRAWVEGNVGSGGQTGTQVLGFMAARRRSEPVEVDEVGHGMLLYWLLGG